MRSARFAIALFFSMVGGALAEEPVHFADPLLKAAVEDALWVTDPTPTDMLGLIELNHVGDWDHTDEEAIKDITGLEYAANLRSLNLRFNLIHDISPLSALTNLDSVNLSQNMISDVSPLSGNTRLTYVNLHWNNISDLSPLSSLHDVTEVILRFNNITDISPLSGMADLRELDIGDNHISDLTPLSALTKLSALCIWSNNVDDILILSTLTNLETLNARRNYIHDLSPLSNLAKLRDLNLRSNSITDISPLCGLMALSSLDLYENALSPEAYDTYIPQIITNNPGITIEYNHIECLLSTSATRGGWVVEPGEGGFLFDLGESVWIEAKAEPGFLFAGWSGTYASTENPLLLTMNENCQMEANFVRPLDILHVDDDAYSYEGSGDVPRSDPNEDGTIEHPFNRIQEAIEVAGDGVTIIVHPGTYCETIDFLHKNIRLTGIDPNDAMPTSWPVLEGTDIGPTVRFCGDQTSECLLTGFIITRGRGQATGAVCCEGASPTIANCLIVGNRTTFSNGAAVYCRNSKAVLTNCTITNNYATQQGAGLTLIDSDVTVLDSIVWYNLPSEILSIGTSTPDIRCCVVRSGWPGEGNFDEDPLFARPGSWIDPDDPTTIFGAGISWSVWADGDYHLRSQTGRWDPTTQEWVQDDVTSPCIDAGLASTPIGNEPTPNGSRINLGAYGGTAEASMSTGAF